jgi:bifunctional DNase/RNase
VAGLPAGQRRAVALHYYAGLPAGQIAEPAGAARASLHKARQRLRAYLTEHRPDLVPAAWRRRTPMTTVRVARFERRIPPGPDPIGFPTHVIILADDAGRRELPIWGGIDTRRLSRLFDPAAADLAAAEERAGTGQARTADELTAFLLRAAGASVTSVDIDELGPEVAAARISLATAAGTRHVTARVAEGLAIAITAGAPVRVADPVMDRLAVPMPADGPLPLPEPAAALAALSPGGRPRYEPRNLAFADGLDGWLLGGSFTGHASHSHWQDYASAAEDGIAVLYPTVPRPAGFAFLGQEMFADDYRGAVVTFGGEFRIRETAGTGAAGRTRETAGTGASRAGLFLRIVRGQDVRQPLTERAAVDDPGNSIVTIPDDGDWTSHQVTARVPEDADTVLFGVFLVGPGRIEMRNTELTGAA